MPGRHITTTPPRSVWPLVSFSPGTPIARSASPSPLTSPQALEVPKPSPDSLEPGTPALLWVSVLLAPVTGPFTPPGITVTLPPPEAFGVPATRSARPSRSWSEVARACEMPGVLASAAMRESFGWRFLPGQAV
ncbi:hypothetical protein SGRIM128S_09420 [Streptomyces griseomycini]